MRSTKLLILSFSTEANFLSICPVFFFLILSKSVSFSLFVSLYVCLSLFHTHTNTFLFCNSRTGRASKFFLQKIFMINLLMSSLINIYDYSYKKCCISEFIFFSLELCLFSNCQIYKTFIINKRVNDTNSNSRHNNQEHPW